MSLEPEMLQSFGLLGLSIPFVITAAGCRIAGGTPAFWLINGCGFRWVCSRLPAAAGAAVFKEPGSGGRHAGGRAVAAGRTSRGVPAGAAELGRSMAWALCHRPTAAFRRLDDSHKRSQSAAGYARPLFDRCAGFGDRSGLLRYPYE